MYTETSKNFSKFTHLNHDLVIIHDPQPLPLVNFYPNRKQPWIFRCHIDISAPNEKTWKYLKTFIEKYEAVIVSTGQYKKNLLPPQHIITPAINPLSRKNRDFEEHRIKSCLEKNLKLDLNIPIISQISRFDRWKDPEGVIKIFEKVKKKVPCQLVLLGNLALDDPEGVEIHDKILKKYGDRRDIKIFINMDDNDFVVNALQRESAVIIQKSTREGFGLTVSEALYKSTPVVASKVGGIPLQIVHGENGFLHDPYDYDGFAKSIVKLLKDENLRRQMGNKGKEFVKKNFLITRLMLDWLNVFEKYIK